ncbi:MAG TPA: alpha/beta hydrolase [Gaiellaceae bacterium]|nr:alpha/beta hydrolase [Gaiellaceae bacterium]
MAVLVLALALFLHSSGPTLRNSAPCPGVAGYTCSTLDVPLDRTGHHKGTLHLRVGAANDAKTPHGVLLVLSGGPGQPGLPILDRFVDASLAAEKGQYRIVVFDQRGTGAGALDCEAMQQQMGSSDLYPPTAAAVRACAAKIGSRRQFYGTDDVVEDIDALRRALGVDKIALDGISYGTYVGERYALAHPDHVSKLVLDSVVPHVGLTDLGVVEFKATARVLRSVCGVRCVDDLAAVVKRYHNGVDVLDALTTDSIVDPTYKQVYDVGRLLHLARIGTPGPLESFIAGMHAGGSAPAKALDQGLHASALCADWRYPWGTSAASLTGRAAALNRAVAKLPASALFPFDRATATGNGFIRQCLPWAPTPPTPLDRAKITVPTLLVNGDHDLSTPLEWARQELARTTKGKLVVVPGAGHSTQSRSVSDVSRKSVAAFLLG